MSKPTCDTAAAKRERNSWRAELAADTFDVLKLYYPADIAHIVGLSTNQINALKSEGCLFYGRKTSVQWVRDHITRQAQKEAGVYSPATEQRVS